ncbi:AAA family ATPase [Kitasatospora sp. NPDC059327]|uniref:AAA family ATPase n=1 Tax=Kitasatospora sp. NPDC059327 TaxID=3346803 RepID=UPI003689244D
MDGYEATNIVSGTVHGNVVQAHTFVQAPAPPPGVPRQIRPSSGAFVNRGAELAALTAALERTGPTRPSVVALTGLGGVGKTEVVARWAEEHARRFPSGQLYADLTTVRHQGGVDLGEVLGGFLRGLGVHRDFVPERLPERAALFRTVTSAGGLLVFLDNVEHASEVRALLPTAGLVVVTGRARLPGLAMVGATLLDVEPLRPEAGSELVRSWLGPGRGTDEQLHDLVRLCGGLPLALQAVGSELITRSGLPVERVVTELADEAGRLAAIEHREGSVVEPFEAVYAHFPAHTRRLYHLVGLHPGWHLTPELAEAAGVERAGEALGELVRAHLLRPVADESADPAERYRTHDLVRLHARRRARADPGREESLRRIVAHYRGRAAAADRALGDRMRLQEPPEPSVPGFADPAAAMAWLQVERADLLAVLTAAAEQGWHGEVWRLCESLWPLYHGRKHYGDWIASHLLGVESAQWDNRPDAGIRMRNQLARAHYELGRYPAAAEQLAAAAELLPLVDDPRLAGVLVETEALLCLADGRPERAVELFTRAREANAGDPHGVVVQSYQLGRALVAAGRAEAALAVLAEAAVLAERTRDGSMLVKLPLAQGRALRALGQPAEAVRLVSSAADRAAARDELVKEAEARELLGDLAEELGDRALAAGARARLRELRGRAGVLGGREA